MGRTTNINPKQMPFLSSVPPLQDMERDYQIACLAPVTAAPPQNSHLAFLVVRPLLKNLPSHLLRDFINTNLCRERALRTSAELSLDRTELLLGL